MKVKNTLKKVGAVAGSALMVGMTMGAAQSLADFPQPFVGDDGTVASQIVVGSQGKVADVVGAVNLAAAMGQSAVQTEEVTETVTGGGGFGWTASDGATLDTRNDNLYFGSSIDAVRQTLTSDHLDSLASSTFEDDDGGTTDVEYFLYPGSQSVQFTQPDTQEDPVLNVNNPSSPSSTTHLFQLQANFGQEINFTQSVNQDVDLELFGTTYTVDPKGTNFDDLVLFGSSQSVSLDAGQTGTVTVNEADHTIELVAVNSGGAAYKVDGGTTQQDNEGDTFTIDGETVRIDNVVNLNDDAGSAEFAVGSDELTFTHNDQIQDSDGNDIDGTFVQFDSATTPVDDVSTIDVYIGAVDDDADWVAAGDSYSHDLFSNVAFQFGGLSPDAAEGAGENVGEVMFGTTGVDTATVELTPQGDDPVSLEFVHAINDPLNALELWDSDEGAYVVSEGDTATQDDYLVTDAGDFSHVFRVTDFSVDEQADSTAGSGDEATVDLKPVLSGGSTIEADLDYDSTLSSGGESAAYAGTEVIDGQQYTFVVQTQEASGDTDTVDDTPDTVEAHWDSGATTTSTGNQHTVYPSLHLDSGAAAALVDEVTVPDGATLQLPSTVSSAAATHTLSVNSTINVDATNFTVGEVSYYAEETGGTSGEVNFGVGDTVNRRGPSALVLEPEDNDGHEHGFIQEPTLANSGQTDAEVRIASGTYLDASGDGSWTTQGLESNTDVTAGYDLFGSYTWYDSDSQKTFTVYTPDGQAVAGAGFTSAGGSLTAGGGTSTEVTYTQVAGMGSLPSMARLDTEVTESVRSNNHLILVGGPAVNTLVSTLVDEGQVDLSDLEGQSSGALLQVVQDAFVDGQHALVVAGVEGPDTRAAAKYLGDYADHETALSNAGNSLVLTESDYPSTY